MLKCGCWGKFGMKEASAKNAEAKHKGERVWQRVKRRELLL